MKIMTLNSNNCWEWIMNISWIKRGMKLFAFIAFVFPLTVSAASYVYTSTADFEGGNLDGLVTDPADQLQLGTTGSTFPVMWIANAGEDTVSKIDTDNNVETARYRTWIAPAALHGAWTGPAPSRTGVDVDGNVFNRGKEQPKLKGTLPITKIKPRKKTPNY